MSTFSSRPADILLFCIDTTRTYTPDLSRRILTYYMEWEIQFFSFLIFSGANELQGQPTMDFTPLRPRAFGALLSFFVSSFSFDSILLDEHTCLCTDVMVLGPISECSEQSRASRLAGLVGFACLFFLCFGEIPCFCNPVQRSRVCECLT